MASIVSLMKKKLEGKRAFQRWCFHRQGSKEKGRGATATIEANPKGMFVFRKMK